MRILENNVRQIGKDFYLEEVGLHHLPELVKLYRQNYLPNHILSNRLEKDYLGRTLCSGEFAFGWVFRYKRTPVGCMLFIRLREGVLASTEQIMNRKYPFSLAAFAVTTAAETGLKAGLLGCRKIEGRVFGPNASSLKNLKTIGFHNFFDIDGFAYFESYLPSISSVKKVGDETGRALFDQSGKLSLVLWYRRTLKVSEAECTFEAPLAGVPHKFTIDRLSEGCCAIEKKGEFRVSCMPSQRRALPAERVHLCVLAENLSPIPKSLEISARLDDSYLILAEKSVVKPKRKTHLRVPITTSGTGIQTIQTEMRFGDDVLSLYSGIYVPPATQVDYGSNNFLFSPGVDGTIKLKLSNSFEISRLSKIHCDDKHDVKIHIPRKKTLVAPRATDTQTLAVHAKEKGLKTLTIETSSSLAGRGAVQSRARLKCRITDKEDACVANIIDDHVLMNNGRIRILVNLRTGLITIRPTRSAEFQIFHFWDEFGPPFHEFAVSDWTDDLSQSYADMYKHESYRLAPLRSTWRKRMIGARMIKNTIGEARVELIDKCDGYETRKEITMFSDSFVRFRSEVHYQDGLPEKIPLLLARICCRADRGALRLPMDGKKNPRAFDFPEKQGEITTLLNQGHHLSENWSCYTFEGMTYSLGHFWEEAHEVDFSFLWHQKMPWLYIKGKKRRPNALTFPAHYFWAGEGDWRTVRELSLSRGARNCSYASTQSGTETNMHKGG